MSDEYLIRRRDKGEKVKVLQTGLIKPGYALPRFGADGDFGAETEEAVKAFQQASGLLVDAVWDSDCQAALNTALDTAESAQAELPIALLDRLIDLLMANRASLDQAVEELMDARDLSA